MRTCFPEGHSCGKETFISTSAIFSASLQILSCRLIAKKTLTFFLNKGPRAWFSACCLFGPIPASVAGRCWECSISLTCRVSSLSVWLDFDDDWASFKRNTIRLFSKGGKSPRRVIARMGLKETIEVNCCPGLIRD